jgi:hypothetical protein
VKLVAVDLLCTTERIEPPAMPHGPPVTTNAHTFSLTIEDATDEEMRAIAQLFGGRVQILASPEVKS